MTTVVVATPRAAAGGVGRYGETFADRLSGEATVRRRHLAETDGPLAHLRHGLEWPDADADVVHLQFEYAFVAPALLFAWLLFPALWVGCRRSDTRLVVTMHEAWEPSTFAGRLGVLRWRYVWLVHGLIAATADALVFLSDNAADRFDAPIRTAEHGLFHGVDLSGLRDRSRAAARDRFGYEPSDTVVAAVGYVSPRKRTETVVTLAEETPYEYLIAGGPRRETDRPYYERIRASAPSTVRCTGVLSDEAFHDAFLAADVALLDYRDIRQSGIFNWCAAYGTPAVCSDLPYFRRAAADGAGVVVIDDEPAVALRTALADRERLADEMRSYADRHSFDRLVDRHLELYGALDAA